MDNWDSAPPDVQVSTPTSAGGSWDSMPPDEHGMTGALSGALKQLLVTTPRQGLSVLNKYLAQPIREATQLPGKAAFAGLNALTGRNDTEQIANATSLIPALGKYSPTAGTLVRSQANNLAGLGMEGLASKAIGGISDAVNAGSNAIESGINFLKSPSAFQAAKGATIEELGTALGPLEGGTITNADAKQTLAKSATAIDNFYNKVPNLPVKSPATAEEAQEQAFQVNQLSPGFKEPVTRISKMITDLAKSGEQPYNFDTFDLMRKQLNGIVENGEGIEKSMAAKLVRAMDQDIKTLGPEFGQDLRMGRGTWQVVQDVKAHPVTQAILDGAPAGIPKAIFDAKGIGGNADNINMAKTLLSDTGYKAAKSVWLNQIIGSGNISKTLGKYSNEFLTAALEPGELNKLQTLGQLQQTARLAGNTIKVLGATMLGFAGIGGLGKFISIFATH